LALGAADEILRESGCQAGLSAADQWRPSRVYDLSL
jgi:hypothetical protein